jgi:hypothetical protein
MECDALFPSKAKPATATATRTRPVRYRPDADPQAIAHLEDLLACMPLSLVGRRIRIPRLGGAGVLAHNVHYWHAEGLTGIQIADLLRCSEPNVCRILKKPDLPVRDKVAEVVPGHGLPSITLPWGVAYSLAIAANSCLSDDWWKGNSHMIRVTVPRCAEDRPRGNRQFSYSAFTKPDKKR